MTMQTPDRIQQVRQRFPILGSTNYLISNSLGAMPAEAATRLAEYAATWAARGVRAWEESWWTLAADLGDELAPLIGAHPGEVVFQPNVTLAHAVLFSAWTFPGPRPKVVTDALHFPSILYLLSGLGAELVVIPSADGVGIDTQAYVDAIDDRTAFVACSHVLFKSAFIQDVAAINAKAHRVGALTIVDGYQSVGTIPVDVRALGVDVYIGGCLKWLCGGPGVAFTWVNPDRYRELTPRLTGWMADRAPFAFRPELDRRDDAWRYLHGTPAIPALYAARPGLRIIREQGIDAIRAQSIRQTDRLLALADQHGWPCHTPRLHDQRGGTVAIDVPHGYEVSRALKERNILCDFRPGAGIRLSPHFYTLDSEIEQAIDTIAGILADESWRAFEGQSRTVT